VWRTVRAEESLNSVLLLLWNRDYFFLTVSGSGAEFRKVVVPVLVPTFEKLWFRLRFRIFDKLRFRFRLHI